MPSPGPIRLQKILADAGVASRRAAEKLIADGAVSVNGVVVTAQGCKANPAHDDVRVNGQTLRSQQRPTYLMLHKPAGYVTSASDEHGRATVFDLLPGLTMRLFTVGRLDRDSEGLLLLTNDGELTARLTHPRYGVEKEYQALVEPAPNEAALTILAAPAVLDGHSVQPARVKVLESDAELAWIDLVVHEGQNRQIRNLCASAGLAVRRLVRVRVGPLEIGLLPLGSSRPLSEGEINSLKQAAGLSAPEAGPIDPPAPRGPARQGTPLRRGRWSGS